MQSLICSLLALSLYVCGFPRGWFLLFLGDRGGQQQEAEACLRRGCASAVGFERGLHRRRLRGGQGHQAGTF